jgi:hypothetical protein
MKVQKTVSQCWAEYGEAYKAKGDRNGFIKRAAKESGATEKHAMKWITEKGWRKFAADLVQPPVKTIIADAAKMGMSLDEFRSRYDEAQKIRNAVKTLGTGSKARIYTDQQFRDLCGVAINKWRQYSTLKEFDANRVQKSRDEMFWTNEETANYLRNLI